MQYASVRQVFSQPPLGKNPATNQECQVSLSIIFLGNLQLLLDVRIKTLLGLVTNKKTIKTQCFLVTTN